VEQDQLWARIISHKYFLRVPQSDLPRYVLVGKGSAIWKTLKRGARLIKDGLFWICRQGSEALFWSDSWDGFPPLISEFPNLIPLC
jgi:hypothetical protein